MIDMVVTPRVGRAPRALLWRRRRRRHRPSLGPGAQASLVAAQVVGRLGRLSREQLFRVPLRLAGLLPVWMERNARRRVLGARAHRMHGGRGRRVTAHEGRG